MLDLQTETGGIVLAFIEVPDDQTNRYGIASVERDRPKSDVVRVTGLVEKPDPDEAPSNLAVVGRYVLPNGIFDAIRRIKPGAGGEIQLTDAMALMLAEGTPVHGIVYRGNALRHRHAPRLPPGCCPDRVPPPRDRPDVPQVADGLRRQATPRIRAVKEGSG